MPKKSTKSKSKRMPLRKKYKIIKKVKAHNKKKLKAAKLEERSGKRKRAEKDPGIPNEWPFKEQELAALEARRSRALAEIEKKKAEKKERARLRKAGMDVDGDGPSDADALAQMVATATRKDSEFAKAAAAKGEGKGKAGALQDGSQRAFYKELLKVVDLADVVIQVLDARDPLGTRCTAVERLVLQRGGTKRIVLLLNKIDLVPREVVEQWLKYLRQELPTLAFKCSTQSQKDHLSQRAVPQSKFKKGRGGPGPRKKGRREAEGGGEGLAAGDDAQTSECLGADTLIQLLKNYARNQNLKTAVTVGIVGLPNVGKSSLINSLKRARVVSVGATPGVTRQAQEIHLDRHVRLLDSPGIVFAGTGGGLTTAAAALRNAVRVEKLEDPVEPVGEIVRLCPAETLMVTYRVAKFSSAEEFVRLVAAAQGKLLKGGVPDVPAAARLILRDWNEGKIPYFSRPPERVVDPNEDAPTFVSEWAKDFDVDTVFTSESAVIASLPSAQDRDDLFAELPAGAEPTLDLAAMEEEEEDEESEEEGAEEMDDTEAVAVDEAAERAGAEGAATSSQNLKLYDAEGMRNPKLARAEKKKKKKEVKVVAEDADGDDGSDYDFEEHFDAGKAAAEEGSDEDEAEWEEVEGAEEEGEDDGEEEEDEVDHME